MNWDKIRRKFFEKFTIKTCGYTKPTFISTLYPDEVFNWFKENLTTKTRTLAQNRSLHLYFKMIADQLNNAGYTFTNPLGMEVPFTMELIKESIVKPTIKGLFNIKSTTKLTTEMINTLIDVFSLEFGKRGIYVEFPNWQSFLNMKDVDNY